MWWAQRGGQRCDSHRRGIAAAVGGDLPHGRKLQSRLSVLGPQSLPPGGNWGWTDGLDTRRWFARLAASAAVSLCTLQQI